MDNPQQRVVVQQVTSESILQEAFDNKDKPLYRPQQSIQDLEELRSFQLTKRREYEQQLNKNRLNFGQWIRYAKWESEHNKDLARARSIFERALDVNVQHTPFWIHYVQFELSNKNINHARNLLDRATTTLPRVNKLWFLYVQTEETLKNYQMVRTIFERWLNWHPDSTAWDAYINFEKRYEEYGNIRQIFIRYVKVNPLGETWLKWIDLEQRVGKSTKQAEIIRSVFEAAVDSCLSKKNLRGDVKLPIIISKWADWEVSVREYERARLIYTLLLDPKNAITLLEDQRSEIHHSFTEFEKNHGNKDTIETSILSKRRLKYDTDLKNDPYDYDAWWAYLNITKNDKDIINLFNQAVSHPPKDTSKTIKWKRFVLIWVRYSLWQEYENNDIEAARTIWNSCLKSMPKIFTFGKIWIRFAEFEIRNGLENDDPLVSLTKARKLLGRAIGQTNKPKRNVLKFYIGLEKRLGEWDRVRKLYERWLELCATNDQNIFEVLVEYVDFEKSLNEHERCVAIYNIGLQLIENNVKLLPAENLWISFINYYKDEMKYTEARSLYRELLTKHPNPKVWISFALFESSIPSEAQLKVYNESEVDNFQFEVEDEHRVASRKVFTEANLFYKTSKDERLVILEAWKSYEITHGTKESQEKVEAKLPTIVRRKRTVEGVEEEYVDYIYPEDEVKTAGLNKFLENARKWNKNRE
jgi:Suppressor of forked protein (Suf).